MDFSKFEVNKSLLCKARSRVSWNSVLAGYYHNLYSSTRRESFLSRSSSIAGCYRWWDIDYYRLQGVKDIKRVSLCHDKFCMNCQNVLSKQRYSKYAPYLLDLEDNYDVYHVVFTVPNCSGDNLKSVLDSMYKKFPYIVRYLNGTVKIKGVSFVCYGFQGAIRSLEVTCKVVDGEVFYHPHFHCLFVLKKGLNFFRDRSLDNDFSFDSFSGRVVRHFHAFEILLQKIWFLLMNDIPVNQKNIESLYQGYSVTCDLASGNYKEVFKYACKGAFKDGAIFDFEVFKTLFYALHRRKVIQGYGIFYSFDFEEDIDMSADDEYNIIIEYLQSLEKAYSQLLTIDELFADFDFDIGITYISRNSLRKNMVTINESEDVD